MSKPTRAGWDGNSADSNIQLHLSRPSVFSRSSPRKGMRGERPTSTNIMRNSNSIADPDGPYPTVLAPAARADGGARSRRAASMCRGTFPETRGPGFGHTSTTAKDKVGAILAAVRHLPERHVYCCRRCDPRPGQAVAARRANAFFLLKFPEDVQVLSEAWAHLDGRCVPPPRRAIGLPQHRSQVVRQTCSVRSPHARSHSFAAGSDLTSRRHVYLPRT